MIDVLRSVFLMEAFIMPRSPNDKLVMSCSLWKMNARAGGKQAVIKIWRNGGEPACANCLHSRESGHAGRYMCDHGVDEIPMVGIKPCCAWALKER